MSKLKDSLFDLYRQLKCGVLKRLPDESGVNKGISSETDSPRLTKKQKPDPAKIRAVRLAREITALEDELDKLTTKRGDYDIHE